MVKAVIVEIDEKGRVHIPSSIRPGLKSRRFNLSVKNGRLLMDPVKPAIVRGKYKGLLKASIEVSKVTDKYQVTIPKDVRESVGLRQGEEVTVERAPGGAIIVRRFETVKDPLSVLIGKRPWFKKPISVEKLEKFSEDR